MSDAFDVRFNFACIIQFCTVKIHNSFYLFKDKDRFDQLFNVFFFNIVCVLENAGLKQRACSCKTIKR